MASGAEGALFADLEARKLDSKTDTTKILVRYLAKAKLLWLCELIHRFIFGSQIAFFKYVNTAVGGVSRENAHLFYLRATEANRDIFPENDTSASFDFLIRQRLVVVHNDVFFLSDFVREFLSWMVQAGVSEVRPL
jgi:hypothetical protein